MVDFFHLLQGADSDRFFCASDPVDKKLGSGGGTTWLLEKCMQSEGGVSLSVWLPKEKRILMHAGGHSRRLPAYATTGKILTPIPVFDWERGQKLSQNLLDLQLPLYQRILEKAPDNLHTLVASGDVYIRAEEPLQQIPDADVVCYGLWAQASQATNHGVYVMDRNHPDVLEYMLQKPSVEVLEELSATHLYLMDIGIWLLSDRAVELLAEHTHQTGGEAAYYDMYGDFGLSLGIHPPQKDTELNSLSVAILPLPGGEFYHFGTSRELISSMLAIQEKELDQRKVMHRNIKPDPAIFVQNALTEIEFTNANRQVWIENSHLPQTWELSHSHVITGVPRNQWHLHLPEGVCIDIVPVGKNGFAIHPYGFNDQFKGALDADTTTFINRPVKSWLEERGLNVSDFSGNQADILKVSLFPVLTDLEQIEIVLRWMILEPKLKKGRSIWMDSERLSAESISEKANLSRLQEQRESFRKENWLALSRNSAKSVFYQIDLAHAATEYVKWNLPVPSELSEKASLMHRIHNSMLRSKILQLQDNPDAEQAKEKAFALLREGMLGQVLQHKIRPVLEVLSDQIVWGRCPVRIDLAGGWTDTPPYSLYAGGNVVNIAIELNGQPPLQVYIKPSKELCITLRSIDLGAMERVDSFEQLMDFCKIGSPFSIPKAALVLAGFGPLLSFDYFKDLPSQLSAFGSGLELTLLSAVPAGSGLGTSSILASTVLGAINEFCGLKWTKQEICDRTLVLEQLLTAGGGWQDQYGGVMHGVKLLQTAPGFEQHPHVKWLPETLFNDPEYRNCHLLYYTGITRRAKSILSEIVGNMFLNSGPHLSLLGEMKIHAMDMNESILSGDFDRFGRLVGKTWEQNKMLDAGANSPAVEQLINHIKDYSLGYKLPGAGGGGYLYMVAKDVQAATKIKEILRTHAPNNRARLVEMSLSSTGLQLSRS